MKTVFSIGLVIVLSTAWTWSMLRIDAPLSVEVTQVQAGVMIQTLGNGQVELKNTNSYRVRIRHTKHFYHAAGEITVGEHTLDHGKSIEVSINYPRDTHTFYIYGLHDQELGRLSYIYP